MQHVKPIEIPIAIPTIVTSKNLSLTRFVSFVSLNDAFYAGSEPT